MIKRVEIHKKAHTKSVDGEHCLNELVNTLPFTVLHWNGQPECYMVPQGFRTDFASIPRILWGIYPPHRNDYRSAAIIHDWLLVSGVVPRMKADIIFRKAMAASGVGVFTRRLFYIAVTIRTITKKIL